jgi:hypothetical protein
MSITRLTTNGLTGNKYDTVSADNYYMEPIATTLVGAGGATSIDFTNIPQGYKHLQIRFTCRGNDVSGDRALYMRLNSDTGSNYAWHRLRGDGTAVSAGAGTSVDYIFCGSQVDGGTAASIFSAGVVDILDYSNVYKFKTVRGLSGFDKNGATGYINFNSGLWMNTAAITGISLFYQGSVNTVQYSRFSLYGIKA